MPLEVMSEELTGDVFRIATVLTGTNAAALALIFMALTRGLAGRSPDDGKVGEERMLEHKSEGTNGGAVARILGLLNADDSLMRVGE